VTGAREAFGDLIHILDDGSTAPRDWRAVIDLAGETLTIGRLADAVLRVDAGFHVPANARELLLDIRTRAEKRNDLLISQFHELLTPLNEIGVRPIVMKGLARLLSTPRERSRLLSDIDLLVPQDRRNDCIGVFTRLGYEIVIGADDDSIPPVFARSKDAGTVDLHTRLKPPDVELGYEAVEPHCEEIWFREGVALLPGPTAQLILTVLHDQMNDRDYWRGLVDVRHLLDIACLVREGVDWPLASSFFATPTLQRAFKVQMVTAHHLLKIDIPEEYLEDRWVRLQMVRRRFQWRYPSSRALLTLLTIAADPPQGSTSLTHSALSDPRRALDKIKERFERYVWRLHPGKH